MEAARKYLEESVVGLTGQSPELAAKYQELLDLFERRCALLCCDPSLVRILPCNVHACV
jgi:hypothetical protein